jgi:lysozyme
MDRERLRARLTASEGHKSKVYLDTKGIPTIGVGRNLKDVGLSDDEIAYLLDNDIKRVEADLDKRLPWWRQLDEVRQSVVADMCFNMGINKLLGFVNTLRKIQAKDYPGASLGMLQSLWATQVGYRAQELARMMKSGQY